MEQSLPGEVVVDHRWRSAHRPQGQAGKDEIRRVGQVEADEVARFDILGEIPLCILTHAVVGFRPGVAAFSRPDTFCGGVDLRGGFEDIVNGYTIILH